MAHRADRTSPADDETGSVCALHSDSQRPQCSSGCRPAAVPHFRLSLRGNPDGTKKNNIEIN